ATLPAQPRLQARLPVAATSPRPGSIRTVVAWRASHVNVVFCPRFIVVAFARSVIVGAGGGSGATGGGGGGGVGAAATFFLQPNDSSIRTVRAINPTFLMREEVIAKPPCRITVEYIRTMLVLCFFRCLSVVLPSLR